MAAAAVLANHHHTPGISQTPSELRNKLSPNGSRSNHQKSMSTDLNTRPAKPAPIPRGKRERPCDACRRRKSKCVVTEGNKTCAACGAHGQDCTYIEEPQPRKRKVEGETPFLDELKRRKQISPISDTPSSAPLSGPQDQSLQCLSRVSAPASRAMNQSSPPRQTTSEHHGTYIGPTTEFEPLLLQLPSSKLSPLNDIYALWNATPFLVDRQSILRRKAVQKSDWQTVMDTVGPHGPVLINTFLKHVHLALPIIPISTLTTYLASIQSAEPCPHLSPVLLAAILTSSLPFLSAYDAVPSMVRNTLPQVAISFLSTSLSDPSLAAIQASLLLLSIPSIDARALVTQLVTASFDLGLHLDMSEWGLSEKDRAERVRLAWAVYCVDKWSSVVHGRPGLGVRGEMWGVRELDLEQDFVGAMPDETHQETATMGQDRILGDALGFSESELTEWKNCLSHSIEIFVELVKLSRILDTVLETFYTLNAQHEIFHDAKPGHDQAYDSSTSTTRRILERAKPVQIKLKEWFASLRPSLRMDGAVGSSSPGRQTDNHPISPAPKGASGAISWLHLAYFATEITLHRFIIRSLHQPSAVQMARTTTTATTTANSVNDNNQSHPQTSQIELTASRSGPTPPSPPPSYTSNDHALPTLSSPTSPSRSPASSSSSSPSPVRTDSCQLLPPSSPDPFLMHVCRAAAKTRLISAMDFVNRLRPAHYRTLGSSGSAFAARTCFALVGSFGALLRATSPASEEERFYAARLAEYRWTLGVSARDVEREMMAAMAGQGEEERTREAECAIIDDEEDEGDAGEERGDGKTAAEGGGKFRAGSLARQEGGAAFLREAVAWLDVWEDLCASLPTKPSAVPAGVDPTGAIDSSGGRSFLLSSAERGPEINDERVQAVRFAKIGDGEGLVSPSGRGSFSDESVG